VKRTSSEPGKEYDATVLLRRRNASDCSGSLTERIAQFTDSGMTNSTDIAETTNLNLQESRKAGPERVRLFSFPYFTGASVLKISE
jgi:hypothetical protein